MSTRRYRNLRAEGKKARDTRKAAIISADEDNGGENAMSPTSNDEKAGGAQSPGEGGDQECDAGAKEAEAAGHDETGANDRVLKPAGPGPSEAESAKGAGRKCSSSSHHSAKQDLAHNSEQGPPRDAQSSTRLRGGAGTPQRQTSTRATRSGSARPLKPTPAHNSNVAQPQQHPSQPVSRPNQANNSRPALTRPSAPPTIPQLNALRAHTIRPESSISQQLSADPAVPGHDRATPLGQHWEYSREEWDLSGEQAACAVISEVTTRRKISNWIDGQSQSPQTSPKPQPLLDVAERTCPKCGSRWPGQSGTQNRPVSQPPAPSQKPPAPQPHARSTTQSHDSPQGRPPSQSKCQCTAHQKERQNQSQQGPKTQHPQQASGPQTQTQIRQGSGAQSRQPSTSKPQTPKQAPTDRSEATIRAPTSKRNQPLAASQSQQNSKPKKPSHTESSRDHGPQGTIRPSPYVSSSTTAVAIASASPSAPHHQSSTNARSQKQMIPCAHPQNQPVPPPLPPPPPPPPPAPTQPRQVPHAHVHFQSPSLSPSQRLRRAADHAPEGCYLTVLPPHSAPASAPAAAPRLPPFTFDAQLADIAAQQQKNLSGPGFGIGFGNLRGGYATPFPYMGACFDPACHGHRGATADAPATTASWHWRWDAETEAHWHGGERCSRDGGSCYSSSSST